MTSLEAFVTGMVWGSLTRSHMLELGFDVECLPPAEGGTPSVVLRTKHGAEILITVTETRAADIPAFPAPLEP